MNNLIKNVYICMYVYNRRIDNTEQLYYCKSKKNVKYIVKAIILF